jgi:hypothetical protein
VLQLQLTHAGRHVVDGVTARRRQEIATTVSRMPADQRTGLVEALGSFTQAGGEPFIGVHPLGWD